MIVRTLYLNSREVQSVCQQSEEIAVGSKGAQTERT